MNWLNHPLLNFLNFKKQHDNISCKSVYLLETDLWDTDAKEDEIGNLYAYMMSIGLEDENTCHYHANYNLKNCHYLKSTNCRYAVLDEKITNYIKENVKLPNSSKGFLKFKFSFTGNPIKTRKQFINYKGRKQDFVTYKLPKKLSENSNDIAFESDCIEIRMAHIKTIFEAFVWSEPLKFNKYISSIREKGSKELFEKMVKEKIFHLYYFSDYFECFKNLEVFVKSLRHFKLMEDDDFILKTSEDTENTFIMDNIMTVSLFMDLLNEKFIEEQSMNGHSWKNRLWSFILKSFKLYQDNSYIPKEIRGLKTAEILFSYCCNYLKNEMLNNNILFLIGGKYDIDFYFDKLYELIYNSVQSNFDYYEFSKHEDKKFIIDDMIDSFDDGILELQAKTAKDLYESEYVHKHFSELLGREVKTLNDYIHVDNMICDYHNMFVHIANLVCRIDHPSCDLFGYFQPIFIDNYNYRVVDGIEIKFENQTEFGQIKAFDENGKEVIFEKNNEYFIDEHESFYCSFEVLEKKKIYEIEVNSLKNDFNKKIKIDTYLAN